MRKLALVALTFLLTLNASVEAYGQALSVAPTSLGAAELIAKQREAFLPFSMMNGIWKGPAWSLLPNGEKQITTQTERVGASQDGSIKVIEGRGYDAAGKAVFDMFGAVSYSPITNSFTMHSYVKGRAMHYDMTPTADGFAWEIPAGEIRLRFRLSVVEGKWREVGERIVDGKEPQRFLEANLIRVGDTLWPTGDTMAPN